MNHVPIFAFAVTKYLNADDTQRKDVDLVHRLRGQRPSSPGMAQPGTPWLQHIVADSSAAGVCAREYVW